MAAVNAHPVIAVVAPLTGGEAIVAQPLLEAVRVSARSAGRRLGVRASVVAFDDHREPRRAARLIERLGRDPDIIGVVGPKNSGSVRAAIPAARAARLPLLLPAATADDLCERGAGVVFRLCATDCDTAAAAAEVCRLRAIQRLCVVPDDTAYGVGLAEAVRTAARRAAIEVVGDARDADAVFHAMGEVEQAEAMCAVRAAGFTGLLLGAEGGPGAPLAHLAGPAGEGSLQLYPGAAAPGATSVYTAEATDAATLLHNAAARYGNDRDAILAALRDAHLEGVSGPVMFDTDGERRNARVTIWALRDRRAIPLAEEAVDLVAQAQELPAQE